MNVLNSQARIFAKAYAKDTAREMLEAIKANARDAEKVTKIALGVSMPHQVGYILGLAPLQWDNVTHILESVTLILGAIGIPIAVDYLILICVRTLVARGAAKVSKVTAFVAMLFPVGVSATVNFLAPAPMLIRILFAIAVVLIPISQGVRAMNRPDFRKVQAMENDVAEQIASPKKGSKCQPGCGCGRHGKGQKRRVPQPPAPVSPGVGPVGVYAGRKA
jgi:hypothetical protein